MACRPLFSWVMLYQTGGEATMPEPNLTERRQKWFATVRAGRERDTGKTMAEWVAIAGGGGCGDRSAAANGLGEGGVARRPTPTVMARLVRATHGRRRMCSQICPPMIASNVSAHGSP